jgi:hypothetical protein
MSVNKIRSTFSYPKKGTGECDAVRKALLRRLKSHCLEVNSLRLSLASQGHDCMIVLRRSVAGTTHCLDAGLQCSKRPPQGCRLSRERSVFILPYFYQHGHCRAACGLSARGASTKTSCHRGTQFSHRSKLRHSVHFLIAMKHSLDVPIGVGRFAPWTDGYNGAD